MRNTMGRIKPSLPILAETTFNINLNVRVRLTERGKEVLLAKILEEGILSKTEALRAIKIRYMRDDEYSFQLYELMSIFGSSLPTIATSDPKYYLFEHNDIVLVPDPLDVAILTA
jgi:hypothetical protein